jgi:hypothetical protein
MGSGLEHPHTCTRLVRMLVCMHMCMCMCTCTCMCGRIVCGGQGVDCLSTPPYRLPPVAEAMRLLTP